MPATTSSRPGRRSSPTSARSATGSGTATSGTSAIEPSGRMRRHRRAVNGLTLQIGVKAGERDRLFGSVTTRDIADRLRQEGIEIDRHDIHLREPIKTVGEHEVRVHVMAGVEAQLGSRSSPSTDRSRQVSCRGIRLSLRGVLHRGPTG